MSSLVATRRFGVGTPARPRYACRSSGWAPLVGPPRRRSADLSRKRSASKRSRRRGTRADRSPAIEAPHGLGERIRLRLVERPGDALDDALAHPPSPSAITGPAGGERLDGGDPELRRGHDQRPRAGEQLGDRSSLTRP